MKDKEASNPSTYDPRYPGAPLDPGPPTRRGVLAVVALISVGLCAALLVHWMSTPRTRVFAPAGIPVSTGIAKLGDIDIFLDALGTVTPVYTVTVTSRVAGEMTQVSFREGQLVKKNDLLAIIDPRPYEAALLQAQGQLARDQALLKNARIDLSRYQKAYEQHAIPEQQLATQEALVEQYDGVVKLDEGNLAAAQVNVDYTRITSPIDGRVGLRSVDPGNIVQADGTTGLATITQLQPITVIFNIAEDDLSKVTEQVAAGRTLRVDALDRSLQHKLAEGTLLTLDNQINPATGTVRGRATFPNTKDELFPNQFVNARLLIKTLSQVDLVPSAAIQRNEAATFVYVVQADSTVQYRDVKVLATEGESTAVTGVQPGEQLVTDGFDRLQAGTKIAVRAAAATPAPAAPAH
ncbi:MAG: efflux RND transporter periplasmic adaptor subunit [Opitutaceae bacterium]|jgi:multidrug efflux system membrane fusion protein